MSATILVVDDHPGVRHLVRLTLESQGYAVVEAADGSSGIDALRCAPDLLLLDLVLPDADGVSLLRHMRERSRTTAPAIGISGHADRLFALRTDGAGFAARLLKPLEPAGLLDAVREALGDGTSDRAPSAGRVVVADDTPLQRKLTRLRLADAGFDVLEAADGAAALELVRRERPDAVVSDVLMPGLDGFELCRKVRGDADPAIAGIPVVLASSVFIEDDDRRLAEMVGASRYVTREPDHASILAALRGVLETPAETRASTASHVELRAERLEQALLHVSEAHARLAAELDRRDAQVALLAGMAHMLATTTEPDIAIREVLVRALEVTGVEGAAYHPASRADGHDAIVVGRPPDLPPGTVLDTAQDVTVLDDGLVLPLVQRQTVVGAVVLGTRGVQMRDRQRLLARAVADQLTQAVVLARTQAELIASREQTVARLARAVALRDGGTSEHSDRMSALCGSVAESLGLPEDRCELLRMAAAMHDIGKVATPDAILLKPGALTPDERREIERHTLVGHDILAGSGSPLLDLAANIALHHHERWDGEGYPRRLQGAEISLEARIAAVSDVFDALTSDRPYRPALSHAEAVAVVRAGRGSQFDPAVVDAFLLCVDGAEEAEAA